MSNPNPGSALPEFVMPRCWRHFFTRHRWWCRACDRVTEDEFRDVCAAFWRGQIDGSGASDGGAS